MGLVIIELCTCPADEHPHQHIARRWWVLLDNDAEISVDWWHLTHNLDRVDAILHVIPPRIVAWAD
jgi:hypothetical protein